MASLPTLIVGDLQCIVNRISDEDVRMTIEKEPYRLDLYEHCAYNKCREWDVDEER